VEKLIFVKNKNLCRYQVSTIKKAGRKIKAKRTATIRDPSLFRSRQSLRMHLRKQTEQVAQEGAESSVIIRADL